MKNLYLTILFCLTTAFLFAQQARDVDTLQYASKEKYTQVDTLDRLSVKLNAEVSDFVQHPPSTEQQEKVIETYKAIANRYAANFHFKQGYIAYQKSLTLKEKMLSAEKAAAIDNQNKQYQQQNSNDEQQVANLQATQQQLSHDIDSLISKRKSFKSIFSVIIAVLSLLFAASLFRSGIKMKDLKNETNANRDKLMQNHRIALLGSLAAGLRQTMISNNDKIKATANELIAKLPNDNKTKEIRDNLKAMAT